MIVRLLRACVYNAAGELQLSLCRHKKYRRISFACMQEEEKNRNDAIELVLQYTFIVIENWIFATAKIIIHTRSICSNWNT